MKGYKATYNMACRGHKFEVGEVYTVPELKICESGFHFCKEMKDTVFYYYLQHDFILLEVEAIGNIVEKEDKCATDRIKIVRVVPKEEWVDMPQAEYDERGNLIHYKEINGFEWWREYDNGGKETHFKDSKGIEYWQDYDERGNLIHYIDSTGYEAWRMYDEKGNFIHYKNSTGYEAWRMYDEKGNFIHYKNSNGVEDWFDENGNSIPNPNIKN